MNSTDDDDVRFSKFLAERYKNITRLAQGGMGVVYRATDPMLGIDVAIKVLKPESSSVHRFQQEARAVAKLHHENLIRELDCGVLPDNSLYIVMEFQDGVSLDELLEKRGRMTIQRALPVFKQIASGMAHAHASGVLHRDLKPSNVIVLDSSGAAPIVKIVDFGIALIVWEPDSDHTTLVGSPLYMAPETSQEEIADERSDIYSLGCLMMECLTLNPPFTSKSAFEVMIEHRDKKPPLLSERLRMESVPVRLENLIDKCLLKQREDRYQSMNELLKDLESIESELQQKDADAERLLPGTNASVSPLIGDNKPAGKSMMTVWISLAVVGSLVGIGFLLAPEVMSVLKPIESAPVATVLEGEKEGDQLIDTVLKDKFGQMNAVGGQWTFNKPGTVDADFKDLAARKDIQRTWFVKSEITGSGLSYLKKNKLTSVAFVECLVNEEGMKQVAEFPSITVFRVIGSPAFTDDALKWILKLPKLKTLYLVDDEALTDKLVDIVVQLPKIDRLSLQGLKQVDSNLVAKLTRLKNLMYLSLQKTGVKGAGLASLAKIKKLVALDVSDLHLTDEQLDYVALPKIQMLALRNSNVTFEGLKKLQRCSNLRILDLRDCPCVTDSELAALKELFPKVELYTKGPYIYHNVALEQDDVLRYVQQPQRPD